VPRNQQGAALIGDPRILSPALHVALLGAHNRIADRLRSDGVRKFDL